VKVGRSGPQANNVAGTIIAAASIAITALVRFGARFISEMSLLIVVLLVLILLADESN